MYRSAVRLAAVVAVLATSLSACSDDGDGGGNSDDSLIIGVNGNNPGLSFANSDGTFSGFDVDMASYIAKKLGWNDRQVTFKMVPTGDREEALSTGEVDMVLSSYSITTDRQKVVDFAGPYFTAGQDLLVAKKSPITGPSSLGGKTVCGTKGSTGLVRIKQPDYSQSAVLKEAATTKDCVDMLLAGQVDAVTTDDAILAGFAAKNPNEIRVVGSPFSTEFYGVGLPKGSPDIAAIDYIIQTAIDDGTWKSSFDRNLGKSGYTAPLAPAPGGTITKQ